MPGNNEKGEEMERDPKPYCRFPEGGDLRFAKNNGTLYFAPRPGCSQDQEDYR